jgi:Tetratricopeptide repeat
MSIAGFIALLDRAGLEPTPLEAAEAIWLARYAQPPDTSQAQPGESHETAAEESIRSSAPDAGADNGQQVEPAGSRRLLPLYLPPPPGSPLATRPAPGTVPVRMPESTALPDALALTRALRPLKRRAADSHRLVLDEAATVDAAARTRAVVPVMRRADSRWLDLSLVTDAGPAMAVWAKMEAELLVLFQRLAAFRDLQSWHLRTDGGKVLGVSRATAGRASHTAPLRDIAELHDPAGRRIVLLLSDGSGQSWYSGAMARVLRRWGTSGPVAILQPLPQQLWSRTALAPFRGRLTGGHPAAPNTALTFTPYGRAARWHRDVTDGSAARPMPVPVLEIGRQWLRTWARFVVGQPGAGLDCAVMLASAQPPPAWLPESPPPQVAMTAEVRVRRFAEQASPDALRLARYLSATPLALPVMRHVQHVLLPGSGPSHLAEVLLGGLLATQDTAHHPDPPEGWRYEFAPGVREVLLASLGRSEARRVLHEVSRQLTARFGRGADEFTAALVTSPADPATSLPSASRPFAEIAAQVLERITGHIPEGPHLSEDRQTAVGQHADGTTEAAAALLRRYQRTGRLADIDEAVSALRDALADQPAGRQRALRNLALALKLRYAAAGDLADLDDAAKALREALTDLSGPPSAPLLAELAAVLGLRFARTGEPADIDEAVSAARQAATLTEADSGEYGRYAGDLGGFLLRRAQSAGTPADLDDAVTWLRTAVAVPAPLDDATAARFLTDLGKALWLREDLDDAINVLELAIQRSPGSRDDDTPRSGRELAARLADLGAALQARARRVGSGDDLRRAAGSYRSAARLAAAGQPEAAQYLAGLGVALRDLVRLTHSGRDLAEAIQSLRAAVSETGLDDAARPERQADLAAALLTRFELDGNRGDLTEAAYLLELAAAEAQAGNEDRARYLAALGAAHERSFSVTAERSDLLAASEAFSAAALNAPSRPEHLIRLGHVLMTLKRPDEALRVFGDACEQLTASLGPEHPDTMAALLARAQALAAARRPDEAAATLAALIPALTRVLGPDHPDTRTARELRENLS